MSDIKLYNGNCLDILPNIMTKEMIIVTDPPFNVGYHYNEYKDNLDEDEYYTFLDEVVGGYKAVVIHYPESLYKLSFQIGRFPERVVSWVYNSNTARQHRDIAFFGVEPDFTKVKQPYKNLTDKRVQELIASGSEGANLYDWFEINQVKNVNTEKTEHPCQMPLKVMENIIGILPKTTIVDPFMGSGTTGVACANLGYDFVGIELDKKYFEIAKERIDSYASQTRLF